MSDDLISRKAVLELLFKDGEWCTDISTIYERVENLKTAFEKEKVIEELNAERNLMYREDGTLMSSRTTVNIDKAIEIVEKGGIE